MEEGSGVPVQRNERLRQQRLQRRWRQQDVADQLNIALVTVQRWEQGTQQPSGLYRIRLCALFGLSAQELGLMEAASPSILSENTASEAAHPGPASSQELAIWTVPYARNPHFTGRDELLDQLMQQFSPTGADQSTAIHRVALTQSQVIKGLGGIGKTQIAVEYAYRAREQERYVHTLWIAAASEEAILTSFAALAELLPGFLSKGETDQHKLVAAVIHWLEQCPQPWLLIADNADDLSLIQPYLPQQGNGSLLLTTRASAVGSLAPSIEVENMGVMEGTQFLLRRAHRFAHASDEEINEAANIVVALAQFPLALDQAGAYIEETGCSLRDYLHIYQQQQQVLLARRDKLATQYPESVATTWSLSFQHIERTNAAAAELLRLCVFLAPDHIPEELLTEGAPHWPPTLQRAVADRFSFNQMIEDLLRFSLVKRFPERHFLSIHRLVQVVLMERMSPQEHRQWAQRLVLAMHTVFPRDPQDAVASWPQCQRYLEQVQMCDLLIQRHQLLLPEAVELLERTGTYLLERALYALAEPLFQRALSLREQQRELEPLSEVLLAGKLSLLYYQQGEYTQAGQIRQRILDIWEQQGEPEHLLEAYSLNTLALLYYQQGKYVQAERLYSRALHIWEQQMGPTHSQVAYALIGLANTYQEQGKYTEAEPLYLRALRIREGLVGPEHFQIANPLTALANLYREQGRYVEAEPFYQRALRIREEQVGPEHAETALLLYDFARFQQARSNLPEAAFLYQHALTILENRFEPNHPLTIKTREHLSDVLVALGRTEEEAVRLETSQTTLPLATDQ